MNQRLVLICICALIFSCKSSENSISQDPSSNVQNQKFEHLAKQNLVDFLRNKPGVRIIGSGDHFQVLIRGQKSFQGNNDPLYVLDGVPIGRTYKDASTAVDVTQIESVKIVPPPRAGRYGSRGQNGVIEIKTKSKIN